MLIRNATESDLPGILAIYNHVIATSNAVYTETPATLEDRQAWFAARRVANYPVRVAVEETLLGFASFGDFRPWQGYALSVEHSVFVHQDARGRGVGSALVQRLIDAANALGKHAIIGGIDAENAASIALHAKLGFVEAGRLHEVARKFGNWLDLVFMQRML